MNLTQLAQTHGTDKLHHRYLPIYERYLSKVDIRSVLEIGVFKGNSVRMWRDRFPEAEIYGLDIDPGCKIHESDRIHIATGSQDDPALLESLALTAGGFDLVVDDGSHVNTHILASFKALWPHTRLLYVIEDLGNSYVDLTPHVGGWPGMVHNEGVDYRNDRADMDRFFMRLVADVDDRKMSAVHFYPNMAVLVR